MDQQVFTPHFADVPIDIYRFFGVDLGTAKDKQLDKLKDISQWAMNGTDNLGDAMEKLQGLETKLGVPRIGQTRDDRIHHYVKLQGSIDDLIKRQEAV